MTKIYIILFIVGIIGGLSTTAYFLWDNMQKKIEFLSKQNQVLEISVQEKDLTIGSLKDNNEMIVSELNGLYDKFEEARSSNETLVKKLEKHELGYLAQEKPALVQKIINKATKKAFQCLSISTKTNITKEEIENNPDCVLD